MSEKNDRLVDSLLDESLRQYGRVQPRAGLEARLLRRLEEQRQTDAARWKFFRLTPAAWGSAAVAAAVLIVAVVLTQQPRVHQSPRAARQAVPQAAQEKAEQKDQRQVAMVTPKASAPPAFSGFRTPERQGDSPKGMNRARPLGFHLPAAALSAASAPPRNAVGAPTNPPLPPDVVTASAEPQAAQFPTPAPLSPQEVLLARLAQHSDPRTLQALAAAAAAPTQPLEIQPLEITPLQPAPKEQETQPVAQPGPAGPAVEPAPPPQR